MRDEGQQQLWGVCGLVIAGVVVCVCVLCGREGDGMVVLSQQEAGSGSKMTVSGKAGLHFKERGEEGLLHAV